MDYRKNIETTYQAGGGHDYHHQIHNVSEDAYNYIAQNRKEKFQPFIKSNFSVLEFGVGQGWNLAKIEAAKKVGYDLSSVADVLRRFDIDFTSDLSTLEANSFDIVLCSHVLEHVANPAEVLDQISNYLKPSGCLILAVPYEKQRRYRKYQKDEPNHHLYSWNPQTLGALVEKCGFEVIQAGLKPFGYERFVANIAAKWNLPFILYKLGLFKLRLIRPEQEVFIVAKKS